MLTYIKNIFKNQKGQGMVEYGLIISLVSVVAIASIFLIGGKDGGGTCDIKGTNSLIGFNEYTYDKKEDTGLYSIYRQVTCQLGGWSKSVIDQEFYNSREEAEVVGFQFPDDVSQTAIAGYTGTAKDIKIPSTIGITYTSGTKQIKEVNQIRGSSFKDKGLNSVILPDTIKDIQGSSFANNNLKSIVIPKNVTIINQNAFIDNKLTEVKFSEDGRLKIDKLAFANNQIKSIIIPSSVYAVENQAFDSNGLKKITINNHNDALNFTVDGKAPNDGWKTGTYNLNGEKWIKE